MIDFIPLNIYTPIFNYFVLFLVVIAAGQGFSDSVFKPKIQVFNNIFGVVVALLIIFYMGWRPIDYYYFGDTINYATSFSRLQAFRGQIELFSDGEWVFNAIMLWFVRHSDVHTFFLFCAAVYVGALWMALVRIFREDYFVPLVVVISMFTFWSYGVNGIRNGMASSVIILAMTYRRNLPVAVVLAVVALGIHKSMALTVAAGVLTFFVKQPKLFLTGWLGCIVLSLIAGNSISNLIAGSGLVQDDRFAEYLTQDYVPEEFSSTGFRWDFLLYSAIPVVTGSYFIFKRKYTDKFYTWIFNIYLITNSFWVLVIRAAFSNRFAQISWFIMPLVLIYPFFMKRFWSNQSVMIGWGVILFYLYTFYSSILTQ